MPENNYFPQYLALLDYSGEIRLGGKSIRSLQGSGYLPEERSLMPKLTILSRSAVGCLKGMSTAEVKENYRLGWKTPSKRKIDR